MRITLHLHCKYRIDFAINYVFTTKPKLLVNIKTGRVINQIMKGNTIGYIINGKFYSLTKLRKNLEVIPKKDILPF
jgi:hypothetical protein